MTVLPDDDGIYGTDTISRSRATKDEIAERDSFLIDYAERHGPITVRGLYYQAEVHGIAGIDKSENGYRKVQNRVLRLRREGRLPYAAITDSTRFMRKPATYDGWENALQETARVYRKALWAHCSEEVEIWVEKSALAGVVYPVTAEYDVPLMCTGGYASETFAHDAVAALARTGHRLIVYTLYDFDRSGQDAAASLAEKLARFGLAYGVDVSLVPLGLTLAQVQDLDLPTRPAKRKTVADRRWPHAIAAELDAIPPQTLRSMVRGAIERHLPAAELEKLKQIEEEERLTLMDFLGRSS